MLVKLTNEKPSVWIADAGSTKLLSLQDGEQKCRREKKNRTGFCDTFNLISCNEQFVSPPIGFGYVSVDAD